jgi:tRNA(Ile)-lysidine synthetase-like protein
MKNLSPFSYKNLFQNHVFRFLQRVLTPCEIKGNHAIAVSAGVDSMALLWLAKKLFEENKIGPIRVLFVHHHTRDGQDDDEKLVRDFCKTHNIPFKKLDAFNLGSSQGNFEARARKIRRELLSQDVRAHERLWLGHQIDDSYEWSLMQRYRSGAPRSSLGIPVRNGKIVRPFLCVTKAQVRRLAQFEKIPFREDPTNVDIRHLRNFLRGEVVPILKKKFPNYLKHYVSHANYMAMLLHLGLKRVSNTKIYAYADGAMLVGEDFSQFQIQELIHHYSTSDRGEIASQIIKMLKAIDNQKKGPFYFSGGIRAYYNHRQLLIYHQRFKNNDEIITQTLAKLTDTDLLSLPQFNREDLIRSWTNFVARPDAMKDMPGLILVLESKNICKTLNTSVNEILYPKLSELIKSRGFSLMSCLKCVDTWKAKEEKLPKALRILPLWTLSNLFTFQE